MPAGRSYVELAKALGAAVRTTYRDLTTLRRAGFPVVQARVHTKPVWRLEGATATPAVSFTPPELTALALARSVLVGLPGSPFDRAMHSAFHKIQAVCDREGVRVLETADRRLFADLRRARPYTEREVWFRVLLDAVARQRTVKLRYFTLEREAESERQVDPYGLVLHEGAFYLVGWCHWRRAVRTFLVDRVRAVSETGGTFTPPEGFSVREVFRKSWGLVRDRALVTVRVRFSAKLARVIREGRWHESQKLEEAPHGGVVLTVNVAGWEEIRRWLLGFGAGAEVLEPEELRQSLAGEADALRRLYGKGRGRVART